MKAYLFSPVLAAAAINSIYGLCGCNQVEKPNILIAISDDQSFDHTSFAGCSFVSTPGFDRVARSGVHFTNCYAGSPGSAPSRSALVTGRHHWQNEQSGQHASSWMKKYVPIADVLKANGYHTGFTGKGVGPFQYARDESDSLWRMENAAGPAYNKISYRRGSSGDERPATGINSNNYSANFIEFMKQRKPGQPFYFWYGATEPHRNYERDSWKRAGKDLRSVDIPGFLPDNDTIRGDILDYAVEIEWFDLHLQRILNYLDSTGELDNTIVIATGDNGMPFPRAKANCYEFGLHVPLAISYPGKIKGGCIVDDPVGFADIAPTIFELTGIKPDGMLPMSGHSIAGILKSGKSGVVNPEKKYVFAGRERHSSSRRNNLGYPQRAIRSSEYLLVWNMKPERWPAGDPQAIDPETGQPAPLYGIDKNGIHNPEFAFTDVDASPSKSYIIENYRNPAIKRYFDLAFSRRPEFELFNIKKDPFCLENLSGSPDYTKTENKLKQALIDELKRTKDPRISGPDPEIFESYARYSPIREFPEQ